MGSKFAGMYSGLFLAVVGLQAQSLSYQPTAEGYHGAYRAEFSQSFDSSLNRGAQSLGDFNTSLLELDYQALFAVSDRYSWGVGAGWDYAHFDAPGSVPVPETVQGVFLRLSNQWRFAERWNLRTELRPGLYSDFEDLSGDDINVPITAIVSYDYSPALTFVAGINFNYQSDIPFIGGPGVIWRFAEGWQLRAVLPKPQVTYSPNDQWLFFAGGELKGVTARVAENFGTLRGDATLNNDRLSHREIRLGAGLRYRFNRLFNVTIEGGYAVDRRFQFHESRLLLNGDGAPYAEVSLNGSY